MLKWLPYPMVRIAGFFMGGVVLGIYLPDRLPLQLVIGLFTFCFILFFILKFSFKENRFPFLMGVLGLTAIFLLGYTRLLLFTDSRKENHFSKIKEPIEAYEAIVRSVPEQKAKSWKIELEAVSVKTTHWQPSTGKLLLYVSKNDSSIGWRYGDRVVVKGSPQEIKPPANPGEFDFKRFLSFKNISHQQFVLLENVKFISPTSYKGFIHYSHRARAWSMNKLNQFIHGEDERAIAIALVLGVTDGIDNDLLNAYAASGAMHVLAVSGMHVGIIYAIILFAFKPLNKYKWSLWFVAGISLILLWTFSFVTGNSPSVLRAVTMFSFIAIARPFSKRTNIYNTLAASAFVLMIYNPYLIMSVGFQLSYLAVIGIVYLQQPLYRLWNIENKLGDWIWQITCVSIAAQLATFGLGLLYFHQFPIYFLVSNLFVIPLSTIILVVGIFLLIISFVGPLASLTGIILEWLIKALNWIVFKTEALPMSLINNIHITVFQCLLLMGILVAMILLFKFKSIKWLYFSFTLTVVFVAVQWNHFFTSVDQRQLIAYSINHHHAIEIIDRGHSYFMADSSLINDRERIRFHVQPNRLIHGVADIELQNPMAKNVNGINFFRFRNKTIAWIKDKKTKLPIKVSFDYLIVSNNALDKRAMNDLNVKKIIFDGSNSLRWVNTLAKELSNKEVLSHSVLQDGAFSL